MSSKLEKLRKIREEINIEVNGLEHCDNKGVNIYISNHNCLKDIFYVPMALDKDIVSLISSRLIYKNVEERKRLVHSCLHTLPIEAHGGKIYSDMCLDYATRIVQSGIDINIFPEGAYIEEDIIHRGRTGAARILFNAVAAKADVNLIPVAIAVDKTSMDLDSYIFGEDNVSVSFLPPIEYMDDFENYMTYESQEKKKESLHNVIDTSFRNIAQVLGKPYDNSYIELFQKKNVIYSSGIVLSTEEAQQACNIALYKDSLQKESTEIIKQLIKNQTESK